MLNTAFCVSIGTKIGFQVLAHQKQMCSGDKIFPFLNLRPPFCV